MPASPAARPRPDEPARRPRLGIALVPGQVLYQLVLLARSPMGPFISIIIPLMLLIALNLVTPEMTLQSLGKIRVAEFLTPAMASFAVLNAGFVNIIIGMTLGRENGILKRFRSTPLPTWAYLAGRLIPSLIGTFALGFATFCALGMAASALVPSPDAALPLAYGVLLPIAFVSQVFFPAPTEAAWLRHLADALPVAPFANAMEAAFSRRPHGLTLRQLIVLIVWGVGGFLFTVATYRWEPRRQRGDRRWSRVLWDRTSRPEARFEGS